MWTWMAIGSALLLGVYDVAKKQALKKNGPLWILLAATALSTLFLAPFFTAGTPQDHLRIILKAFLVSLSWISGMMGIKLLPLTTVSTIKGSRPMFILLFSIILYSERLNLWQWAGTALILTALLLLGRSSRKEGIRFSSNKGLAWMVLSVVTGAASALYDKHILFYADALFVQCWSNFYISAVLALTVLVKALRDKEKRERLHWDWMLPLIAALITVSDFLYFHAVQSSDALLAVISMLRRCSIVVTFALGAWLFREKRVAQKAFEMVLILTGATLLMLGS